MAKVRAVVWLLLATVSLFLRPPCAQAETFWPWIKPEQRKICVRHPSQLPHVALPETPPPATVSDTQWDVPERNLSLDDAIRTALGNSEVIRVLGGVTAVRSGSTIYDVAITNNNIDVAQGRFDPFLSVDNFWNHAESPFVADPGPPLVIGGTQVDLYDLDFELTKTNLTGGFWAFGINEATSRPGQQLDFENPNSLDFSYTQPLLRGAGRAVNQVPIVLARIDTERSYFQYKNSVQQLVRDVIGAYWNLVSSRTVLWARQQQVDQAQFALDQALRREAVGDLSGGEVSQPRVSLANFKSTLIAAKADVLQAEAALRSIMGLPPYDPLRLTPITPPTEEQLQLDWQSLVSLAEEYRPDIIELKLILEADQQNIIDARNFALPQLNAFGLYRWNGLEGVLPVNVPIRSQLGETNDWTLGINFSVPIGLRSSRAQLRQQELIIARDRANLTQQLLTASHLLAANLRNLDQFYAQYQATRETRAAARENLEFQIGRYNQGLEQYIVVLQAIVSWGDAVSAEAQLLSLYNIEQANLELQTGTILETHDVFFFEERYASLAPLSCVRRDKTACYPRAKRPGENTDRYPYGNEPSEEFFDLTDPLGRMRDQRQRSRDLLPPLDPPPPAEPIDLPPADTPITLRQPNGLMPK